MPRAIHRQNLVIEAGETGFPFRHNLRLEAGLAITWHRTVDFAKVTFQFLFTGAIAAVTTAIAHRIVLFVAQMRGQFGFHRTLDQGLGQLLEQPVFAHDVFRLLVVGQQLVNHVFVDFHGFFSVSLFFPREKPFTQSFLYPR
jgi:hypothetical protein